MGSAHLGSSYQAERMQSARQEFVRRFDDLYRAAGSPSLRGIAVAARQRMQPEERNGGPSTVSAQRISDWKAGRNVPARFDTLRAVLVVLGVRARRSGAAVPELLDLRAWRLLWDAAKSPRPGRVADLKPMHIGQNEPRTASFGFAGISLGCDDLEPMVGFYMKLLGGQLLWSNDDNAAVRIFSGLTVVAHRVSEYVTPAWPGTSIVHFCVATESDIAEYETRALRIGARVAAVRPDRLQQIADVVKIRNRCGETVVGIRNNSDRLGYLIVTGDSEVDVANAKRDALQEIHVVYRDPSVNPDRLIHD